jgi:hypothetical protein
MHDRFVTQPSGVHGVKKCQKSATVLTHEVIEMQGFQPQESSMSDHDVVHNPSRHVHFQTVLAQALAQPTRRSVLRGGLGLASLSLLPGCSTWTGPQADAPVKLGFESVGKSLADDVILPPGYQYRVLHASATDCPF